jgi:chemotaxis protein CheX
VPNIPLPKTLDLGAVSDFATHLLPLRGDALQLDAGAVQKLTGIGLEMLVSTAAQWRADGQTFEIVNWSDAALDAMNALGTDPSDMFERS